MPSPTQIARRLTTLFAPLALFSCASDGSARDNVADSLELPPYTVELVDGDFELRSYAPVVVARTFVEAENLDAASNQGFRRLAGYIFGGNTSKDSIAMTAPVDVTKTPQKIAMTAPVDAIETEGGVYEIVFTMPSNWTLETLPVPDDDRVELVEKPGRRLASVIFPGFTDDKTLEEQTALLEAWIAKKDLSSTGERIISRYNDPFTFPWNRRNEVQLSLR